MGLGGVDRGIDAWRPVKSIMCFMYKPWEKCRNFNSAYVFLICIPCLWPFVGLDLVFIVRDDGIKIPGYKKGLLRPRALLIVLVVVSASTFFSVPLGEFGPPNFTQAQSAFFQLVINFSSCLVLSLLGLPS